ncbi:MAG: Xaa-Pro peptidase family protein [Planctomycetes bacterium]|nr:Xaa-Pro peptidase family protein [Planctomycetota bacterium]
MDPFAVNIDLCRARQQRLLEHMGGRDIDLAIVTQVEHVQWLSGVRFAWTFQPVAALTKDGELIVVAPQKAPETLAADEVAVYDAKRHSTMRNDQRQASSAVLKTVLEGRSRPERIGVEFSTFCPHLTEIYPAALYDIEPPLYELRRRKDADELAKIKKAIAATGRMYERARQIIAPGVGELEVFNQLQAAAVEECGEMLTGTGNDYQCASRGGPPRGGRTAAAGELYILDLGPAFRGYFADNARTIAVSEPTHQQQTAWEHVTGVLRYVQETVKPGVSARLLFAEAQAMLDAAPVGVFNHHLGHGIGLFPHEAPHLNPHWNDEFQAGEVFAAEPGLYAPELNAGMRIENDYLVTDTGVEILSDFPLELR